jgi:hypothetical protein
MDVKPFNGLKVVGSLVMSAFYEHNQGFLSALRWNCLLGTNNFVSKWNNILECD